MEHAKAGMGGHEGVVFVVPCLPLLGPEFSPLEPRLSVQPHGAWKTPRLTNLPSRFYESHSSGVPFGICILGLKVDAWHIGRGRDKKGSAFVILVPAHNSRDRLRDWTRYGGISLGRDS